MTDGLSCLVSVSPCVGFGSREETGFLSGTEHVGTRSVPAGPRLLLLHGCTAAADSVGLNWVLNLKVNEWRTERALRCQVSEISLNACGSTPDSSPGGRADE